MILKKFSHILVFFILAFISVNTTIKQNSFTEEDISWLVKNVYFEARNQSVTGQLAVIMVTINRVNSNLFPTSIKGVVTQGGNSKGRCQFSWYCDGKKDVITDYAAYGKIRALVLQVLPVVHTMHDVTKGALFYHATYVRPKWSNKKKVTAKIETHIFYK